MDRFLRTVSFIAFDDFALSFRTSFDLSGYGLLTMLWRIDSQLGPAQRQRLISPLPWTTFGQMLELVPASNTDKTQFLS